MDRKIGCLIIHGFAGGVHEVSPLAEYLMEKGFEVACPKLKGHTTNRKDMSGVTYDEWVSSAEEELLKLKPKCDEVVLIGFSMGGLVAINLLMKHDSMALITLSTPIYHWDLKRVVLNIIEDFKTGGFVHIKHYQRSSTIPVSALLNFKVFLAKTKKLLKEVKCPVFVAQGMKDDTVQHRSAEYIYNNVKSEVKDIKYYSNARHVICLSSHGTELFRDVEEFINRVAG